jgi:hypothetical protein
MKSTIKTQRHETVLPPIIKWNLADHFPMIKDDHTIQSNIKR